MPTNEALLGGGGAAPASLKRVSLWLYLLLASIVLLISALLDCCTTVTWSAVWHEARYSYAVLVGAASAALCLIVLLCEMAGSAEALRRHVCTLPRCGRVTVSMALSGLLVAWWATACTILTFFHGPFQSLSNAYFALWAGLALSLRALLQHHQEAHASPTAALFVCSVVVLLAASSFDPQRASVAWAISLGVVSAVLSLGLLLLHVGPGTRKALLLLLLLLWIPGAGVLTFVGPFLGAGNGYFAAWLGLLCSTAAFLEQA